MIKSYRNEKEIDWPLMLVSIALLMQFGYVLFELLHHTSYGNNGIGIQILHLFGKILNILS